MASKKLYQDILTATLFKVKSRSKISAFFAQIGIIYKN